MSVEEQLIIALRRITRAIDLRSRVLYHVHGLTVPQLTALQAIARLQPVTPKGLAAAVHLGPPTVTGILERLQRQGWIQRTRGDSDRRIVWVSLTESGAEVLASAPPLLQDPFRDALHALPEWEQTQILATLQRVAEMMDAVPLEPVVPATAPTAASAEPEVCAGPLQASAPSPLETRPCPTQRRL